MNQHYICIVVFVFVFVFCINDGCDGKLPNNIKICSRNDPNIAKCIIESIKLLQPRLANGQLGSEFQVPPLEPLKLDNIHIDRGPNFQVNIQDLVTRGASKFIIEKMKVNLNEPSFDLIILLPKIEYRGKYNLKVRLAVVPLVVNNAEIIGVAENYKSRVRLQAKKFIGPNGLTYIKFDKIQLKIIPGKSRIELKNLFENNPTLKTISNVFVNENSNSFAGEVIPALERSLSEIFTKAANEIVKSASFDELFPNI